MISTVTDNFFKILKKEKTVRVIASVASSWDGKITLPNAPEQYVRLSSDEDIRRLKSLRDTADAILIGGATFRAYPKPHFGLNKNHSPIHCLLTQGKTPEKDLLVEHPFWKTANLSIVVFCPEVISASIKAKFPPSVSWVQTDPGNDARSLIKRILSHLTARNVDTLLIEGGGRVIASFIEAQALQELYLTLCPLLIGGKNTPSLFDGHGEGSLLSLPKTKTLSFECLDGEYFYHLSIEYPH